MKEYQWFNNEEKNDGKWVRLGMLDQPSSQEDLESLEPSETTQKVQNKDHYLSTGFPKARTLRERFDAYGLSNFDVENETKAKDVLKLLDIMSELGVIQVINEKIVVDQDRAKYFHPGLVLDNNRILTATDLVNLDILFDYKLPKEYVMQDLEDPSIEVNEKITEIKHEFSEFMTRNDWQLLNYNLKYWFDGSSDIKNSNLAVELHKLFSKAKLSFTDLDKDENKIFWLSNSYPIYEIHTKLLDYMKYDPSSVKYLEHFFKNEDSIEIIKFCNDFNAYYHGGDSYGCDLVVINSLSNIGTKDAISSLQEILKKQNQLTQEGNEYNQQQNRNYLSDENDSNNYISGLSWEDQTPWIGYRDSEFYTDYHLWRELFSSLSDLPDGATIPILIDSIKVLNEDSPVYYDLLVTAFNNIDKLKSAQVLLELAKSDDVIEKRIALSLLNMLDPDPAEVGQDGVEFLGKKFDLGDYNSSEYYIQRITGNGEVGIFNKDSKSLEKFFSLDGLSKEEFDLKVDLLNLTYKAFLFADAKDVSEQQVIDEFLKRFIERYEGYFEEEFLNTSKVSFRDLSFHEQSALVKLLEDQPVVAKKIVKQLAAQYGLNGVKTVLALNSETAISQMQGLMEQARSPKQVDSLELLFCKYAFIMDSVRDVESYISNNFEEQLEENPDLPFTIKKNILKRANLVISDILKQPTYDKINHYINQLKNLERESVLFAQIVKESLSAGESLENIKGTQIQEIAGGSLSKVQIENMLQIYETNWITKTSPEYWAHLKDKFLESVKTPHSKFYVLTVNDKLVGFLRFSIQKDEEDKDYLHAGAFNIDPSFQNSKIGEVFFENILKNSTGNLPIHAETNPSNPMLKKYLAMGFEITNEIISNGEPEVKLLLPIKKLSAKATAS